MSLFRRQSVAHTRPEVVVDLPSEPDEHAALVAENVALAERLADAKLLVAALEDEVHMLRESPPVAQEKRVVDLAGDVRTLEAENAALRAQLAKRTPAAREAELHRACLVLSDALAVSECRVGGVYAPVADPRRAELLLERVRAAVAEVLGVDLEVTR